MTRVNYNGDTTGQNFVVGPHASNGGVVYINYDHGASRTISTKEPFSNVPYALDPDHIDRPEIMTWLHHKLTSSEAPRRAVLYGLGGIGYASPTIIPLLCPK